MDSTHVFLGPTLLVSEARKILPEAVYHPPIACGDLTRLLRLQPKVVLIIDGLYESVPAVWHKEILLLLEKGVRVVGASSMGALRASELHHFGMEGVGKIFKSFRDGALNDDDEVAVLHLDKQSAYQPINDAMVSIRETLSLMARENLVQPEVRDELLNQCKRLFYPKRKLQRVIEESTTLSKENRDTLLTWLAVNGVTDLKKQDAIEALSFIQKSALKEQRETKGNNHTITIFTSKLIDYAQTSAFNVDSEKLPECEETLAKLEQDEPRNFAFIKSLSLVIKKFSFLCELQADDIEHEDLLAFIAENRLYNPQRDFALWLKDPEFYPIYGALLQFICLSGLTASMILPMVVASKQFYRLSTNDENKALRIFSVLLLLFQHQFLKHKLKFNQEAVLNILLKQERKEGEKVESLLARFGEPAGSHKAMRYLVFFSTLHIKLDRLLVLLGNEQERACVWQYPRKTDWVVLALRLFKTSEGL